MDPHAHLESTVVVIFGGGATSRIGNWCRRCTIFFSIAGCRWGPEEADELLARDGRHWFAPE